MCVPVVSFNVIVLGYRAVKALCAQLPRSLKEYMCLAPLLGCRVISPFPVLSVVDMAPFRWPECNYDVALATEVIANRPQWPLDWDSIAETLSSHFSTEERPVRLSGRACRDRLNLLLAKHKADDAKGLKRHVTVLQCVYASMLACFNLSLDLAQKKSTLS